MRLWPCHDTWLCVQVSQQDWRFAGSSQLAAKAARGPVDVDRNKSVFVKNVPFSAEDVDVADFFSRAGAVVRLPVTITARDKLTWSHTVPLHVPHDFLSICCHCTLGNDDAVGGTTTSSAGAACRLL